MTRAMFLISCGSKVYTSCNSVSFTMGLSSTKYNSHTSHAHVSRAQILLIVETFLSKEQVIRPLSISFKLHCQHFQHCSKSRRNLAFTEHCLYPCPRDLIKATISFMIVRSHTYIVCPCFEVELD